LLARILSAGTLALAVMPAISRAAQVAFDVPSSIECRDVTGRDFALAHPNLKNIEGRFRISAWIVEGSPSEIVDFVYVFKTERTMRVQTYSPNTTLESAVAEDHIEITDEKENSTAAGLDGHVASNPLALGASRNQTSKKSEASHYKQIAPKDTVLSSGTIDREHGVIFRIRPSRASSLEGAKEFTFTATVPKTWRGDLCTLSCTARTTKHSVFSNSVVSSGSKQVQVGMYLVDDPTAAALVEELRICEANRDALAKHSTKDGVFQPISTQSAGLFGGLTNSQHRKKLQEIDSAIQQAQTRLKQLAR
jgi:hypothetical protein